MKPSIRCEYSRCKDDVTHEAFCKWNGVTIYFCAKHLPKWAVVGAETDTTFYRVRPLRMSTLFGCLMLTHGRECER